MVLGDGDWQDRLEAVFRKYNAPQSAAQTDPCASAIRDVHIHLHFYPQPPSGSAVVRPLTRRWLAAHMDS